MMQDCDTSISPENFVRLQQRVIANIEKKTTPSMFGCRLVSRNMGNLLTLAAQGDDLNGNLLKFAMSTVFGMMDTMRGPFIAFPWQDLCLVYPEYATIVDSSSISSVNNHLTEDMWLTWIHQGYGLRTEMPDIEADSLLPESIADMFNQRRRWTNGQLLQAIDLSRAAVPFRNTNAAIFYICNQIFSLMKILHIFFYIGGQYQLLVFVMLPSTRFFIDMLFWALAVYFAMFVCYCSDKRPNDCVRFLEIHVYFSMVLVILLPTVIHFYHDMEKVELLYHLGTMVMMMPLGGLCLFLLLCVPPSHWWSVCRGQIMHVLTGWTWSVWIPLFAIANLNSKSWGLRESREDEASYSTAHEGSRGITDSQVKDFISSQRARSNSSTNCPVNGLSCETLDTFQFYRCIFTEFENCSTLTSAEFSHRLQLAFYKKVVLCIIYLVVNITLSYVGALVTMW